MKLVFKGARPREIAPVTGRPFIVSPGETFEVDNDLGKQLLAQPRWFEQAKAAKANDQKEGD